MKRRNTIIEKRQMFISMAIILGMGCADANAAASVDQAGQTAQTDQATMAKKSKRPKNARKTKQSATSDQANQQSDSEQLRPFKQADQSNQLKVQPHQPILTDQSKQPLKAKNSDKPAKIEELAAVEVEEGRAKNLIGVTGSASQGELSQKQFEYRPLSRNGELVEVVPGAVATQHSGSGKANQYFLRGYNLDHGTDFTTIVDGIPMNMASHAHGQGYMDLNSLIPELVNKVEYGKGPYYAEVGDFSAAGYAKISSMNKLDQGIRKLTAGSFDYYRTLVANSQQVGEGNLLYAGEFNLYNGVWQQPEDSRKFNGILRYTLDQGDWGLAVNAKAYNNTWTATNQIPQAAIDNGTLGVYGTMDPSDGGKTNRYSLSANLWNKGEDFKTDANIYALYYDVDLYSNFTGFFNGNNTLGDQIHQYERRVQTGGNIEHTRYQKLLGFDMDNTIGVNFRHDQIMGLGLDLTVNRGYLNTVNRNDVSETTGGIFIKNQIHWLEKFRTIAALRADFINNDVKALANSFSNPSAAACANNYFLDNNGVNLCGLSNPFTAATINAANSGNASNAVFSPKFSMILGPWYDTEYFVNIGYGYHSNDARGTTQQLDPNNGSSLGANGMTKPLAWARGGEVGARNNYIAGLNSTVALWWLESSSELVWSGDAGNTSPNGKSYRYGVEFTNYYKPTDWLTLDADLALTTARYAEVPTSGCVPANAPGGDMPCSRSNIPNSVGRVVTAGATAVAPNGLFGTIRLRHFGDVALDSQGTWGPATSIVNLGAGYKQKSYQLELDLFNIFDSQSNDIAYAYATQYPANATAQYGIVKHPVEPRMLRGTITINF